MAWSNAGLPLVGVLFLLAYFWGWGSLLLTLPPLRLGADRRDPLLVLALGVCAALLAIYLLGLVGLLRRPVLFVLALGIIGVGFRVLPPWEILRRRQGHGAAEPWTWWDTLLATIAAAAFLVVAGLCLLPDDSWDTVAYHLAIGKIYVQHARMTYIPWLFQSNFPVNGELFFLHGLLLDGDRLALPLNLVIYAVAAAAVFEIARLELRRGPALLAMVVFMVSPEVTAWVNTCNVEIAWTAFATVALWCGLRWRRESASTVAPHDAWLYLAGLFAGCAGGTKVVGLLSGTAVGVIIFGSSFDRRRALASLGPVLKYGVVFVLAASPCYLKAYAHTGTPLWPETLGLFEVPDYSSELWGRNLAFGRSLWAGLPMTPANLVLGAWERKNDPSVAVVTVFALATLFRWRRFHMVAPLFLFVVFHYAFWCYATQQSRFLIPALPAAIVGLMWLTYGLANTAVSRYLCAFFWLVTLSASVSPWMAKCERFRRAVLPVLSGTVRRDDLLRGNPLYVAARHVDGFTEPDAKILLFQEVRGYFLDRDYMWGDPLNQGVLRYRDFASAEQLRQAMRRLGVSHVLVGRESFPFTIERRYAGPDWDIMADLLAVSRRVFTTDDYVLYAVDRPPLDPAARVTPVAAATLAQEGVIDGSVAVDVSGYPLCQIP